MIVTPQPQVAPRAPTGDRSTGTLGGSITAQAAGPFAALIALLGAQTQTVTPNNKASNNRPDEQAEQLATAEASGSLAEALQVIGQNPQGTVQAPALTLALMSATGSEAPDGNLEEPTPIVADAPNAMVTLGARAPAVAMLAAQAAAPGTLPGVDPDSPSDPTSARPRAADQTLPAVLEPAPPKPREDSTAVPEPLRGMATSAAKEATPSVFPGGAPGPKGSQPPDPTLPEPQAGGVALQPAPRNQEGSSDPQPLPERGGPAAVGTPSPGTSPDVDEAPAGVVPRPSPTSRDNDTTAPLRTTAVEASQAPGVLPTSTPIPGEAMPIVPVVGAIRIEGATPLGSNAALGNLALTTPLPTATLGQLQEMQAAGQTQRRVVLRLDPPELGTVRLELTKVGEEVLVAARTETVEAARALLRQHAEVRSAIEALGLTLTGFDVETPTEQGARQRLGPGNRRRDTTGDHGDISPGAEPEQEPTDHNEGAIFL